MNLETIRGIGREVIFRLLLIYVETYQISVISAEAGWITTIKYTEFDNIA